MSKNTKRITEKFFNFNNIEVDLLKGFSDFLDRMPNNILKNIQSKVDCIDMTNIPNNRYEIKDGGKKDILIAFGNRHDLQHSSIVGLIAHLFALISIDYHNNSASTGKKWLMIDLYSDNIAKQWGFVNEVQNLRKIRPQKIPDKIEYPKIVVNHSVSKQKFKDDLKAVLKKINKPLSPKIMMWYIDRFSMICSLQNLRKNGIKTLYIVTDKYTKERLKEILGSEDNI